MSFGSISRGALGNILLEISGLGLAYLAQIVLARWLGAADYGRYAYVISITFVLAVPVLLGLEIGLLRFIPSYRAQADVPRAVGFLRRAFALPLGLAFVVAAATSAAAFLIGTQRWNYADVLTVGIWALPFVILSSLSVHMGRAIGRFFIVKAVQDIGRPLLLIGALGLAALAGLSLDAPHAIVLYALVAVTVATIQCVVVRRDLSTWTRGVTPIYDTRVWLSTSLPFLLTTGSAVLLKQTDVLMIGLLTHASDVGVYVIASRLADLVTLSLVGANMLAAPAYARLYSLGEHKALQRLAGQLAHLTFWPAVLIAIGLALLGRWLLDWFGPAFAAGYPVVLVLAIAGLVNVGTGSVGYLANMIGEQSSAAKIRLLAAALNVGLNAIAIPRFGMLGAAASTATAVILTNLWLHAVIVRRRGVRPSIISALSRRASDASAK